MVDGRGSKRVYTGQGACFFDKAGEVVCAEVYESNCESLKDGRIGLGVDCWMTDSSEFFDVIQSCSEDRV